MPKKVSEKQKEKVVGEELVQLIVFDLADEEYGVRIGDVKEIIRTGDITQIPDSPEFIAGVINVRGNIIPVFDLSEMFFLAEGEESKHIIVTEQGENTFGLMVDGVTEVLRVEEGEIKPAPMVIKSKIHGDYLKGVVPVKDRLVTLLDFKKMLSDEEFARLDELAMKQHRKIKPKKKKEKTVEESTVEPRKTEEKPSEPEVETQIEEEKKPTPPSEKEEKKEEEAPKEEIKTELDGEKTEKAGMEKIKQPVEEVEEKLEEYE
jgi:purine-binding chemotaxis protein CheW